MVLIGMIYEISPVCGSLQQHSGEESLRRGYLESQNQVHNYDDGYDDFEPRPIFGVSVPSTLIINSLIRPRALTEQVLVDDIEADEEESLVKMSTLSSSTSSSS